jgi:putative FmdB family regulatory protein
MFPPLERRTPMPIYEYRCDQCGHEFEELQRITAPPLETCPVCGHKSVHRLISHSSFILKGSGWYVTDYARKGASSPDSDSSGGSSSSSSSNSKPASGAAGDAKPSSGSSSSGSSSSGSSSSGSSSSGSSSSGSSGPSTESKSASAPA